MKPYHQNRSRAYYRHHRRRMIQRKLKIAKCYDWHFRYTGQFAKGKVHCSCWMCAVKTKKDGFPHSQVKQLNYLQSQLEEYLDN
ncbi:hypothetical protein [Lysinibacillus piscis]|uniref:Uncharacterized protein n=1 Tax=Lysinibacillus piscis TaxID=2518931 RepID=A0ABQ5NPR1_9BACI|nr:hypothetical protein [Lysinibacillus sp. KH24]GLC90313.1 hypothetical protein LYSBPC_34400 [Lysinibacillus sp. KH24]